MESKRYSCIYSLYYIQPRTLYFSGIGWISFPFEIVIHDDASTDGTTDIIKEYENKFPEIVKPIYETENQYSKKDNTMELLILPHLKGKYTAFCEGDDFWTNKKKLQMQVDFLENNPDYGFCCTDVDIYYEDTNKYDRAITKRKLNNIIFDNGISSTGYLLNVSWLFKTDLYNDIVNRNSKFYYDRPLQLFYEFCLNTKCKYIDCVTATYRRNPNGISFFTKEQERKQYDYFRSCFELIIQYLPKFNCSEEYISEFYTRNIEYVLKPAIKYGDDEIIQIFLSYVYQKNGLYLCELYDQVFKREKQVKESLSYRIGNFLLWPLKRLF